MDSAIFSQWNFRGWEESAQREQFAWTELWVTNLAQKGPHFLFVYIVLALRKLNLEDGLLAQRLSIFFQLYFLVYLKSAMRLLKNNFKNNFWSYTSSCNGNCNVFYASSYGSIDNADVFMQKEGKPDTFITFP